MYKYEDGYPKIGYNTFNTLAQSQPITKIIDEKSDKHFALLLSTQQSVEEFQIKSGMLKPFTTEYQYHYWALVARVKVEEEVLDIAIPTVLFNYDQEVNGAAVDFHLNDVEKASNDNAKMAEIISNIIVESSFGKFLSETFQDKVEWMNVPMNTCHVHPGQLSTFSGTDYCKTITDPGICFPLSEPHEQPSFSSIICHQNGDNVGKVVRTEYRFASKIENNIVYKHGTCLAYWKGHVIKGYKNKLPLIKSIFTGKDYDEKPDLVKPNYINKNGLLADTFEDSSLLNQIIEEFNKLEFSPYTEDIKADRIQKQKIKYGNLYGKTYGNPYGNQYAANSHPKTTKTAAKKSNQKTSFPSSNTYTLVDLRKKLAEAGYENSVVMGWDWQKCKQMYDNLAEMQKQTFESEDRTDISTNMSIDEIITFLLANGFTNQDLKGKSIAELNYLLEETILEITEFEEEMKAKQIKPVKHKVKNDTNKDPYATSFLNAYGYKDKDIKKMSPTEISSLLDDLGYEDSLFDYANY